MKSPKDLVKRLDSALNKRRSGYYSEALDEFERLEYETESREDIAMLRLFQVTCLTDMGDISEALKRISRIEKTNLGFANQVDFEFEFSRIERAAGEPDKALNRITNALKTIDDCQDKSEIKIVARNIKTLQGILLAEIGRCEEAMPIVKGVPVQDEGWAKAKMRLGDCNYKIREFQRAIDCYSAVVSSDKKVDPVIRHDAIRNIGYAFYDSGDYAKAVEYLSKVRDAYDAYPNLKTELLNILASAHSRLTTI
jgi:tetratricopeptide (TPR) repeat protein